MPINKKNQISIFIIITIIIVIIGVFLFVKNYDSISIYQDEKSSYKIKKFVESCIEINLKEAQEKIAQSGGWYYSPPKNYLNKDSNKYLIKNSEGIQDLGNIKIPYWYYYDDSNEKFEINIPKYNEENDPYSIKNQFEKYILENIEKNCLNGFNKFKNEYEIQYKLKDLKVNVNLDKEKIESNIELPIKIIQINSNNSDYISKFSSKIENQIYIPYRLARDITISEIKTSFVEYRILNMMTPYQTSDRRDLLPPNYDFKFTYDLNPWVVPEVEKTFKNIISSNIRRIQFYNTDYDENEIPERLRNNEFVKNIEKIYLRDYISENVNTDENTPKLFQSYKNYKVKPKFDVFYPIHFNIGNSLGNMILTTKPEAIINFIPIFFTEYVTSYQITMPIVFEIKKSNDKYNNFKFNFAIEANIDYNQPLAKLEYSNIDHNIINNLEVEEEKENLKDSLICSPYQFISKKIYLNLTDPINYGNGIFNEEKQRFENYNGIKDAVVEFDCKGLTKCTIGKTDINFIQGVGNKTNLALSLPINCNPGKLEITKFGHKKVEINNLNPNLNNSINLGEVIMPSKKEFKLKITFNDPLLGGIGGNIMGENDEGFIIFKDKEDENNIGFTSFDYNNIGKLNISLTPGEYEVEGFVFSKENKTLPATEIEGNRIPEIKLNGWLIAGYKKEFSLTLGDALNKNIIEVPFVKVGYPSNFNELQEKGSKMNFEENSGIIIMKKN
jgi:hypothetical protein